MTGLPSRSLLVLALCSSGLLGASEAEPIKLDLARALALAREHSPLIRAARERIQEAEGGLTTASILLRNNPVASYAYGHRENSDGGSAPADYDIALSQEFEVAGQRRARMRVATAGIEDARASTADIERTIGAAVAGSFFEALAAAEKLSLVETNARLAEELFEISRVRVEEGASAPIDLNASRIRLALARGQQADALATLRRSRLVLLSLVGIGSGASVDLVGSLPAPIEVPAADDLLRQAYANRPDILAAEAQVRAAEAEAELARAEAWPSPVLGAEYSRDDGDQITSGTLSIALPVFQRNQGVRQRTEASLKRVLEELALVKLQVEREVRELITEYERARATLALYDEEVVKAMEENVLLLRTMLEAGKVGYTDVALLQRERIETGLALLQARADVATTEVNLRSSAGLPLVPAPSGGVQ